MARGFLGGMILGAVVSVAGAAAISLVIGPPNVPRPEATALEVPAGSEFDQSREDREASVPAPLPQPQPGVPPAVEAPTPDTIAPMASADTDPAAQPQTGTAEDTLTLPASPDERGAVQAEADAPVLPSPQAALPVAPQAEESLSISTDPAQPSLSQTAQEETALPAPPDEPEMAEPVPATPAEPVEAEPVDTGAADAMAEPAAPSDETAPEGDAVADTPAEPPVAPSEPEVAQIEDPEAPAPVQTPDEAAPADTEGDDEDVAALRPSIGTPAQSLTDRDSARVSSRLPSVGGQTAQEDTAEAPAAAPADSDLPPLQRYAAPFENPDDKPLMAIVLIDRGEFSSAVEALTSFPYPISFAIDPTWDGAADAMARYRAAGFEVLALADIPEGAMGADVEVNLAATLDRLPEAVAVMEGDGTGLQSSRAISDQVSAYLADSGHGLVMFPQGLDTARKLAEKEGVPAATLFRDFDGTGQEATVIRRFLDQAAFKAAQETGVIMVGRTRPETISALILWGLADRAERVALAPVSAVLRARAGLDPAVPGRE